MSRSGRGIALVAAALLGACSLAPKYSPPPAPQIASYKETGDWMPAVPGDGAGQSRGEWWQAFGDARLNGLENDLVKSNPDVAAGIARYEQARALALQSISNVFPLVNANASDTRSRTSGNSPLGRVFGGKPFTSNDFVAGINLSWEIDLFGRLRNAAKAAGAQAQASAGDLAALELTLEAELASDYFSLCGDDDTIKLLEDTIQVYDRAWTLTRNRYQEGISAATDVDQADTLRQNARAQLAAVRNERAQLEHAIAVLLGQYPSVYSLDPGSLKSAPPAIEVGLPSTLLQQRPDVGSAERQMAAANAQIGVARAAWFPVFSLTGAAGFESVATSTLLQAPSRFWSVGPSGNLPLLDAGGRVAVNREARAQFDAASANYRKVTLTAFQEVEDSLASLHHLTDELHADQAAAKSAESSAFHADKRYEDGVADYVEVTTTHTAALQADRDTITTHAAQMNASVTLVRATGGGWTRDRLDHPVMP